ncbi:MAG TPA: hypothetical protein VIJ25_13675, partial [Methylococcales bacterium]
MIVFRTYGSFPNEYEKCGEIDGDTDQIDHFHFSLGKIPTSVGRLDYTDRNLPAVQDTTFAYAYIFACP